MEYYDGKLCISKRELVDSHIVSESNYRNWTTRRRVEIARRGGGNADGYALVIVDSLPTKYRDAVRAKFGSGDEVLAAGWFRENYERDIAAVAWFHNRENTGTDLPADKIEEYVTNAGVLNCCLRLYTRARDC